MEPSVKIVVWDWRVETNCKQMVGFNLCLDLYASPFHGVCCETSFLLGVGMLAVYQRDNDRVEILNEKDMFRGPNYY